MPKKVDHEARRAELAEALWRVLARDGVGGASVRRVAAEAGWTRGNLEHYFASRDELVLYACRLAVERTLAQVAACARRLRGRAALRAIMLEGLALSPGRREAAGVWLALLSEAGQRPELAAEFARFDREMRALLAGIIAEAVAEGEAPPGVDAQAAADALFAFNIGLATRVRLEPERYRDEVVAAEVDGFLEQLLPPAAGR